MPINEESQSHRDGGLRSLSDTQLPLRPTYLANTNCKMMEFDRIYTGAYVQEPST